MGGKQKQLPLPMKAHNKMAEYSTPIGKEKKRQGRPKRTQPKYQNKFEESSGSSSCCSRIRGLPDPRIGENK